MAKKQITNQTLATLLLHAIDDLRYHKTLRAQSGISLNDLLQAERFAKKLRQE